MGKNRNKISDSIVEIKDSQSLVNIYDPVKDIANKFDFYIKIVIGILVIAMLTMIVMTVALIIDSFHINSATYKEYSEKIETLNTLQETSKKHLEVIQQNQKVLEELLKNSQKR